MSEWIVQALLLVLAVGASALGMACFALTLDTHWQQVRGGQSPTEGRKRALRIGGALSLLASLCLCLIADHPGMAALVWVMSLAVGTLIVAFALTRIAERKSGAAN
jgi:hypothetical protein